MSNPQTITIPKRFCGPVASANGGYASGVFANYIDGPATVTLKAPPPLDTPMDVETLQHGKHIRVMNGPIEVADVKAATLDISPPIIPTPAELEAARDAYPSTEETHPLPGCFVCGPGREKDDGLRIFAGIIPESDINADVWHPAQNLADDDGLVRAEFLWAALDCPSGWATRVPMADNLLLLGRFTAAIKRRPAPSEKIIAAAWATGHDGRKHHSQAALIDEHGETIAAAEATWLEINDPGFLKFLKTGQ